MVIAPHGHIAAHIPQADVKGDAQAKPSVDCIAKG